MWKYREPSPEDYDTEEEYLEAMEEYESAEDQYADDHYEEECLERYFER